MPVNADSGINTKVETLIEAIEDFGNAQHKARTSVFAGGRNGNVLADARKELANALREFLKPRLRVIEGEGRPQDYELGTVNEDKPLCLMCNRRYPCITPNCPSWARAIRRAIDDKAALEDEGPDVA